MTTAAAAEPAIELRGAGVLRQDRWILRDIDWTVPAGGCAAILGPNGSGKSTVARIVAGHLWPTHGTVRVLGHLFGETDLPQLRKRIGLVQPAGPYDVDGGLSAHGVVLTGFFGTLGLYDAADDAMHHQAEALLAQVGLRSVAEHRYDTLSSGERIRCLLARALAARPSLLLLDEPTSGLDLLAREQVLATIQHLFERPEPPPTVVIITHHIEELPPATSAVLLLREGAAVTAGEPRTVLTDESLSRAYGVAVRVRHQDGRLYSMVSPSSWDGLIERSLH